MKLFLLTVLAIPFFSCTLQAQEITDEPICFTIRNTANHRVYGEIATHSITAPDGQTIHHTGTFRLEAFGTRHPEKGYLTDRTEFCSTGPFYPGRQLELTIRTLFPIFSCKTSVELGEIVIQSNQITEDGQTITKTWATCL
tara:strand:+ start:8892 stop:9314 length:423 start_codon:yes stop_codon:yes gene_type:complete